MEGECQELRKYKEQQQREMEDLQKELSLARVQSGASISSVVRYIVFKNHAMHNLVPALLQQFNTLFLKHHIVMLVLN